MHLQSRQQPLLVTVSHVDQVAEDRTICMIAMQDMNAYGVTYAGLWTQLLQMWLHMCIAHISCKFDRVQCCVLRIICMLHHVFFLAGVECTWACMAMQKCIACQVMVVDTRFVWRVHYSHMHAICHVDMHVYSLVICIPFFMPYPSMCVQPSLFAPQTPMYCLKKHCASRT